MKEHMDDEDKLNSLRVEALYEHSVIPVVVMLCGAIILISILWNEHNAVSLLIWLFFLFLITIIRYLITLNYHNAPDKDDRYEFWLNMYLAGAVMSGLLWGTTAFVFITSNELSEIGLLTIFILVVAAGSIGIYSIFQRVYYGFNLPAVIPLVLYQLNQNDEILYNLGLITTAFVVFIFIIQGDAHRVINKLLVVKLDNRFLLDGYEKDQDTIKMLDFLNIQQNNKLHKIKKELKNSYEIIKKLKNEQDNNLEH